LTVDQYHPLRPLATLGFTDGGAPFLAGAKLPSKKVSSHRSRPSSSSAPRRVRHASNQTPSSSHCCSRRQQVEGEGNSSGRKRHAAPVCKIHKMPSKHARFGAGGRPRLSRRCFGGGNSGSIRSHCSSVNSFCRFFMTEAHPIPALQRSTYPEAEPIFETRSRQVYALESPIVRSELNAWPLDGAFFSAFITLDCGPAQIKCWLHSEKQ
jgi:hypothetical protein